MFSNLDPKIKTLIEYLFAMGGILLLVIIWGEAMVCSRTPKTVEAALQQAEEVCRKELEKNGEFKQVHLNSCSAYIWNLSQMRLDWQKLAVENSPGYDKIEKEYIKWHEKRQKSQENQPETPENMIPGSIKVMEKNLESAARNQKEIEELEKFKKR